jgi:hypothetical protein
MEVAVTNSRQNSHYCHVVGSKGQEKTPYGNEFASCKFRIIAVMSASSRPPKRNA